MRFLPPNKSSATDATAICRRCGEPFTPRKTGLKTLPLSRCCELCCIKNLHDGLDLPTPPEYLDPYTKNPTLTDEEYFRKLKENGQK